MLVTRQIVPFPSSEKSGEPSAASADADRPTPDARIVNREAGHEIFGFASGHAILHSNANDLVAGRFGAVPGAVLRREDIILVFRWDPSCQFRNQRDAAKIQFSQRSFHA